LFDNTLFKVVGERSTRQSDKQAFSPCIDDNGLVSRDNGGLFLFRRCGCQLL